MNIELIKRIISAVILAPLFIYVLYRGGDSFYLVFYAMTIGMMYEWLKMWKQRIYNLKINLVPSWYLKLFLDHKEYPLLFAGFIYIILGMNGIINLIPSLNRLHKLDLYLITSFDEFLMMLYPFIVIWSTDIAAFFTGRTLGGPKLAPSISPNKTWSGFLGGLMAGTSIGTYFLYSAHLFPKQDVILIILASMIISFIGEIGDLIESWAKRLCGLKDSGKLIPGHGGLLDRFDSILAVGFIWSIFLMAYGLNFSLK